MHTNAQLMKIWEILTPVESTRVISALRQDGLVWDAVIDGDLYQQAAVLPAFRSVSAWIPARLAMLAAGDSNSEPQAELSPDRLQAALQAYDMLLTAGQFPADCGSDLAGAGLAALALRERQHLSGSWDTLLQDPCQQAITAGALVQARWRTVLTCLYGMVTEPLVFLRLVANLPAPIAEVWCCHCVLTTPQTEEEQKEIFLTLLQDIPLARQIGWCKHLRALGYGDMAQSLAQALLPGEVEATALLSDRSLENLPQLALDLQEHASLCQLAGDFHTALNLLAEAQNALLQSYAELRVQSAGLSEQVPAWEEISTQQLVAQAAVSPRVADNLLLGVGTQNPAHDLTACLPADETHGLSLLHRASIAAGQGDLPLAQDLGRKSAALLRQEYSSKTLPYAKAAFAWNPINSLEQFEALDLVPEACQLVDTILVCRPVEEALLHKAVTLYRAAGDPAQALAWTRLCVLISPQDLNVRRTLAALCEAVFSWEDALHAWEAVLRLDDNPRVEDHLGVARCAFHCEKYQLAQEVCQMVLSVDPDLGLAHALLGEIALHHGQREEAVRHLSRATLLSPEEPQPWLSLASMYQADGEAQRELQTLHAAVLAVPESGDLHFALAKVCLKLGTPSEALPHLHHAARLLPGSPDVAWILGKTLNQLGHSKQARRVLEAARARWPQHPYVAVADAETMIEAGDLEAAILPLEVAINSEAPESEWYLLYAKALLGFTPDHMLDRHALTNSNRLQRAELALFSILGCCPQHFEAGVLLAETLQAQDSTEKAFAIYSGLVERSQAALPEWRWRVQAGFGQVALANNEVETAVAALREATQAQPENVALHQLLATAYCRADLADEAAQVARQTVQLAPGDLANLSWYIETMKGLGKEGETVDALQAVTRLAPERADVWNLLAQVQTDKGDITAAQAALQALTGLEDLNSSDYQHAAFTYSRLNDPAAALACLDQAVAAADPAPASLLFEVAVLRHQLGRMDEAQSAVHAAALECPDEVALQVFQADLLAEQKQHQPALACLEHALRLLESQPAYGIEKTTLQQGNLPSEWWESLFTPAAVYTRLALLLRASGALAAALNHAEKALEIEPVSHSLRYLAADLAYALLDREKAVSLANQMVVDDKDCVWSMALAALQIELALDAGEDSQAGRLAQIHLESLPQETRFLAIQARMMLRVGNQKAAQDAYAAAILELQPVSHGSLREIDYQAVFGGSSRLALAETALELEHWGEALKEMEAHTAEHPQEVRAHLRYARALVLCAEQQRLCAVLRSSTHAPGADALSGQAFERFERAIQTAARLANTVEVATWQARGRAVFQPGLQNAPALARLPNPGEHAPALLAMLRLVENTENAIRIMPHYPQTPALLLELALCYAGTDKRKGLEAAIKAVEARPDRPLYHAARALLAESAGEDLQALHAIQTALTYWPDEPAWQSWAARLCKSAGDTLAAIAHYEQCLSLDPGIMETALALSQLYLASGQSSSAATVLERACLITPDNVEAYLLLAQARRMLGDLAGALENTETAARLAPNQSAPKLMSGEIALQMGKTTLALQHARAALACKPDNTSAVLFLSRVLVQTGALSDGLAVLEKALPSIGKSQPVMLERANLIRRLYGPQVALSVFIELGQIFPQDAQVLSLLAQTQADCGDLKAAERSAYAAYQINPDMPQLNVLLGRLQRSSGQLDQSIHFFSEAIRQSPADIEPYLDLGEVYLNRREHLQALHTYQQAIKVAPRDFRPFYQAAAVLRDSKDYLGAEAMLRRAAELAPGDLNIRRQLGAVIALNLVHNSQEANSAL